MFDLFKNKKQAPKQELEVQNDQWIENDYEEGQLAIDVYETEDQIIIKSTMAGVKPEDIDISINNDMLTIRGKREEEENIREENYLYKECYWGSFSRSIILPTEVDNKNIDAELENGVLTVSLKKVTRDKKIEVNVKG
ncbi:Hsp20 family protein [Candidatus Falkowbacteria bacterium]|nr:Hsp20 family protein [Candidatus Falkowbacteria bacterium]